MTDVPRYQLDETLYSKDELIPSRDEFLPKDGECLARRDEFVKAIRSRPSLMFRSAVESIEAAITLLALRQISQAYLLLFQAAEVSMKGLLDEVRQLGIAAWGAKNPGLFRNRAKDGRSFDSSSLRETVKEKTFISAFREVDAILVFSDAVRHGHTTVNNTRRDIIHRGGEQDRAHIYVREMLTILFPLLDEFYFKALRLQLADLILHDVARELLVASRYLRETDKPAEKWDIAQTTVYFAYFHRRLNERGAPSDFDPSGMGWNLGGDLDFDWEKECLRRLRLWDTLEDVYITCRICDARCFAATDGELVVESNSRYFAISRLICPYCHLDIDDPLLTRLHYGTIDRELLGGEAWISLLKEYGYHEEAKQEAKIYDHWTTP